MVAAKKPTSPAESSPISTGFGHQHAHGFDVEDFAIGHEANALALAHGSLHHAHQHDDAAIGVEPRIEDEGLQRRIGIPGGRRQAVDDGFEHFVHALAGLGAHWNRIGGVQPDGLLNGFLGADDVGRGQVDFVDDGNDFEAVVDGEVSVGEGLGFHALACVDHQQRAFAGGQRARDLVAEVDVAGGVDQVELVGDCRPWPCTSCGRRGP